MNTQGQAQWQLISLLFTIKYLHFKKLFRAYFDHDHDDHTDSDTLAHKIKLKFLFINKYNNNKYNNNNNSLIDKLIMSITITMII